MNLSGKINNNLHDKINPSHFSNKLDREYWYESDLNWDNVKDYNFYLDKFRILPANELKHFVQLQISKGLK